MFSTAYSSLLFFHFYHRWAKKRTTPNNLVPRYVFEQVRLQTGGHGVAVRLTTVTGGVCGRGGKTAVLCGFMSDLERSAVVRLDLQ